MGSTINKKILILDYGVANYSSIYNMLYKFSSFVFIGNSKQLIKSSDLIILPGVGTFFDAMKNLRKNDILENLKKYYKAGNNILGICLGMQILTENSNEINFTKGLNFINGCTRLNNSGSHVGWNKVFFKKKNLFSKLQNDLFYFQHSYNVKKIGNTQNLGYSYNNNEKILSLIKVNNLVGTQFHPEKSQNSGLKFFNIYFSEIYE